MKWSVRVIRDDAIKDIIDDRLEYQPNIYNFIGRKVGEIKKITAAVHTDGTKGYFIECEGSRWFYLRQWILSKFIRRTKNVYPFWISEKGWA